MASTTAMVAQLYQYSQPTLKAAFSPKNWICRGLRALWETLFLRLEQLRQVAFGLRRGRLMVVRIVMWSRPLG